MTKYIIPIAVFAFLVGSCATSNKYMADDIYVLKPSDLAVGESSADETTYSAFKKRKQGEVSDRQMYADQFSRREYQECLNMFVWRPNCGCTYTQWVNFSPYSYSMINNRYGNPFFMNGMGMYAGFNNFGMSPHMYMYGTGMYGHYGMYGNPYWHHNNYYGFGSMYGYGNMYGHGYMNNPYGFGYGGYGYGGNGNIHTSNSNVYNGPRGTSNGFANPRDRNPTNGTLKSGKAPSGSSYGNTPGQVQNNSRTRINTQTGSTIERKPIAEIKQSTTNRDGAATKTPTYDGRNAQPTNTGSRQYSVSGTDNRGSINNTGVSPARNTGTGTIRQTAPRDGGTISPTRPTQQRTPSPSPTIQRSGGSINSGSSGGSSGGSRGSGSTNSGSSGGRR